MKNTAKSRTGTSVFLLTTAIVLFLFTTLPASAQNIIGETTDYIRVPKNEMDP